MIGKFATAFGFRIMCALIVATILTGASTVYAQQTPAQAAPAGQPPAQKAPAQTSSAPSAAPAPAGQAPDSQTGIQEASPDEISPRRKTKPHDYKNWAFNVGGGGSLTNGTTRQFVRGGGAVAAAGVARNFSKYLGIRADFQWDNLPLRNSTLQLAQAPGATSQVYSVLVDPIINIPVTKLWGGYILAGPAFFHRSGKLDSSTAVPGSACNAFFAWWGSCFNSSLPLSKSFLSASQNEFGANFGGGVTRRVGSRLEVYAEFRYLHGKHNGITTDLRPVTIGLRW